MAATRIGPGDFPWRMEVLWAASVRALIFALALMGLTGQLLSWTRSGRALEGSANGVAVQSSPQLPVGLILPVRLENAISLKEAQKGVVVEARITQEVPLPDRGKIAVRSLVKGPILGVEKDAEGAGAKLTLSFTQLEDRKKALLMATSLRAIASYTAIRSAQTPWSGDDAGTPSGWANTIQIGGDIRYGDGGMVRNRQKQKVGQGVLGGVLVHVQANPELGCEGPIGGDDHPQALWVFSADACGVYSLKGIEITHNGKTPPTGQITLHFEKDDMKLDAGTGLLLRVVAKP